MAFFTYSQNNSGGVFCEPAKYVIIEADSADEANRIAEDNGLYFDGCMTGSDCSCCGDRWYRAYDGEGEDKPMIYSDEIALDQTVYKDSWGDEDSILIVRKDRTDVADLLEQNGFGAAAEFLRNQS